MTEASRKILDLAMSLVVEIEAQAVRSLPDPGQKQFNDLFETERKRPVKPVPHTVKVVMDHGSSVDDLTDDLKAFRQQYASGGD